MVSLAEKLASNITFDDFKKATDLKHRLFFTLLILVIYRLGSFIPLPGIDASVVKSFFNSQSNGGILSMFDVFTGGSLSRMTIFALNIMPYISASIIISLLASITPSMMELKKEGESGYEKMNQYTRYLTVFICMIQAYGIAVGLEHLSGSDGVSAVINPGMFFRFSTMVSLLGGTMLVMWLGEQITSRGVGQGTSLIIFVGIIANLPSAVVKTIELGKVGQIQPLVMVILLILLAAVILFVVFMEQAQRRIMIHYPKQTAMMSSASSSHLPLKLNTAGVIPPIFAGSILAIPAMLASFISDKSPEWLQFIAAQLNRQSPVYFVIYAALIVFFSFFYTAIQFNPEETAENLKNYGGFIPGIRPGRATAEYLDYVLTRITVIGSIYLVVLCLLPDFLINKFSVPFYLGGTTLLIVCNVITETVAQIQSYLISNQYQGILKNTSGKMKRRFVR
ncbi:MAG: preprotein translocase subunit SecY [Alphaproteobacteria bacterium]|nr:preprotein translocase subunit SecY [Alphaproteobacteria bacterium]MBR4316236.1 preprotein translocase subunit SecY [Alphaproteobacteria bacterium]